MTTVLPINMVRTDNPDRETWRYLQLFSKESYVNNLVTPETAKNQIMSCIRQATEIYTLSKSASILTKPILLYYGMQRLAKALIFLRSPEVDPNNLKSHGLSGRGIYDNIEKFLDNRIPKTQTGIFPEFSKWATKNYILLKKTRYVEGGYHYPDYWVHECNIPDSTNASTFKVYDLFSLIPELSDLFDHFQMKHDLLVWCGYSIQQHRNGLFSSLLTVRKKLDFDSLKTRFPAIEGYTVVGERPDVFTISRRGTNEIGIPCPLVQDRFGLADFYLVTSTSQANKVSDLNVHFILMFLLCHIARYKAPLWKEIIEGTEKNENIALIGKFIEVSEIKFPKLILDELVGQYFMYTQGEFIV